LNNFIEIAFGSKKLDIQSECKKLYGQNLTKRILQNTGPKTLRVCEDNENSLTLAINAFTKLTKKNHKINFKNLIFVTENNLRKFPGNSFLFASNLKLNEEINLYDLNSGCTGFVDAIKLADKLKGNTMIICSETYSKNIRKFNRDISTLFADAAVAFYYENKKFKVIDELSGFKRNSYNELSTIKNNLKMDGKKVFNFVRNNVMPSLNKYLKRKKSNSVKNIYLHQASKVVLRYFEEFMDEKYILPNNLVKRGNTVSSTIPVLIYDNLKLFNNNIILCGFGVGLSYSIVTLRVKI
tara:strand:+ start:1341 stop:2228 length:888 start_codon:yes stop_codon:yes gene_type:complete